LVGLRPPSVEDAGLARRDSQARAAVSAVQVCPGPSPPRHGPVPQL